jgi:ArsR family transcriptional regulator
MAKKFVDPHKALKAGRALVDSETLAGLSETFKVLGDPTRLQIVIALSSEELCVQDIAAIVGMTESSISHQLRVLKTLRLVKQRRSGKLMYYSLDDEHIEDLIRVATRHISE